MKNFLSLYILLYRRVQRFIVFVSFNILGICGNSTDSEGNLNLSLGMMANVEGSGSIDSEATLENIHPPANQLRQTWLLLKRNFLSTRRNYVCNYNFILNCAFTRLLHFNIPLQRPFNLTTFYYFLLIKIYVMYSFSELDDVETLGSYSHSISFWILIQRCWEWCGESSGKLCLSIWNFVACILHRKNVCHVAM